MSSSDFEKGGIKGLYFIGGKFEQGGIFQGAVEFRSGNPQCERLQQRPSATLASDTVSYRYKRHPTPHMVPTVRVADWLACPIQCDGACCDPA